MLFKQWVGLRFEYIEFYKDSAFVYNPLQFKLEPYNVEYDNTTVTLIRRTVSPSKTIKRIKLNIVSCSTDTLQLTTTDSLFYEIEPHRTKYTFISKSIFSRQNQSFQKLFYTFDSGRNGVLPYLLEIDSIGCIHIDIHNEVDNKLSGIYVGRLHIGQFKKLMKLIEDSDLHSITNLQAAAIDGFNQMLFLVNDNQEHFYYHVNPSEQIQKLTTYLHTFYKTVPLQLTKEKFEFSKP